MRKLIITAAAAVSALAIATPAAAQYYPQQGYGYDNGYGYSRGGASYRNLQVRIDRLQQRIRELDHRNLLTHRQAAQRYQQSRIIERQLHNLARNGLSRQEAYNLQRGIADFERQVWRDTNGGRGWANNDRRDNWRDRDRDGRHDRWEDDRGRDHDDRWDDRYDDD